MQLGLPFEPRQKDDLVSERARVLPPASPPAPAARSLAETDLGSGPIPNDCRTDPGRPPILNPGSAIAFVRHPKARRYVIRVRDDGSVRVTIPRWGSRRGAAEFAERERAWIDRQIARNAERRARKPLVRLTSEERKALVARARVELTARLLELAAEHGLSVEKVSIRNQRWRWGSCSRTGRISLNWRLVAMPGWVRDYVLIHELMHLRRMDHSPRFWALVAAACPGYRDARTWLRAHADLLADTAS